MTVLALVGPLVALAAAVAAFVKLRTTPAGLLLTFVFAASVLQELLFPWVMRVVPVSALPSLGDALGISSVLLGLLFALGLAAIPRALR